jgi:glycerol-3-phosphate dehydrogenase
MTVEDFLSRRCRQLLLDRDLALLHAPAVANLMASELKKEPGWIKEQINNFNAVAANYKP